MKVIHHILYALWEKDGSRRGCMLSGVRGRMDLGVKEVGAGGAG